jgi:ferrous iron transport protein B
MKFKGITLDIPYLEEHLKQNCTNSSRKGFGIDELKKTDCQLKPFRTLFECICD